MKKEEYSYGEILFALREEYRKNEELLNSLKQFVLIEDDQVTDYELRKQYSSVYVRTIMRQNFIEKVLKRISSIIGFGTMDSDVLSFQLSTNNPVGLIDIDKIGFVPNYTISNPEEIRRIVKEIESNGVDPYSGVFFGRCSYYRDNVPDLAERIYIKRSDCYEILLPSPKSPFKTITYTPDILTTKRSNKDPGRSYCTVLLRDVLATKMPGKIIPDKIREIIDRNLINNLEIEVERQIVDHEELSFAIERDRQRVLLRPKNPN